MSSRSPSPLGSAGSAGLFKPFWVRSWQSACNASTLAWFSLLYVGVGFLADGLMTGDWLGGIIWEGCFGPGGVPPEAIAGDGMVALETGTDGCMGPDLLVESGCGMDLDEG